MLNQAALLAVFGLMLFGVEHIPSVASLQRTIAIYSCMFVIACLGLVVALFLARLVMRRPTLVISADGITDNGSYMVTGVGLIRWNEIMGVRENKIDLSTRSWRDQMRYKLINGALDIALSNKRAVFQRVAPWKTALIPFCAFGRQPLGRRVIASLLDRPAAQLVAEIDDYIKRHAPADDWHARMLADEDEGASAQPREQ